ncbi:MAG: signal peptidase II [Aquificota bacterium]|nr:MAG: signal peptidase II [Aquificota bacterium]
MRNPWTVPLTIALIVLVLDRWTKSLVIHHLPQGAILALTPFLNLVHVRNPGGAFGMGSSGGYRSSFFFIVVSLIAILVVISLLRKLSHKETLVRWSLGAVLGGGLGNLIDRLLYGRVIDFIDFHIAQYHWPAFNLADSVITVGLGLALWGYFKGKSR